MEEFKVLNPILITLGTLLLLTTVTPLCGQSQYDFAVLGSSPLISLSKAALGRAVGHLYEANVKYVREGFWKPNLHRDTGHFSRDFQFNPRANFRRFKSLDNMNKQSWKFYSIGRSTVGKK